MKWEFKVKYVICFRMKDSYYSMKMNTNHVKFGWQVFRFYLCIELGGARCHSQSKTFFNTRSSTCMFLIS